MCVLVNDSCQARREEFEKSDFRPSPRGSSSPKLCMRRLDEGEPDSGIYPKFVILGEHGSFPSAALLNPLADKEAGFGDSGLQSPP